MERQGVREYRELVISVWRLFYKVTPATIEILALFDSNVSDPVNIGNPTEYTMLELAALVCEVAGARPDFVFKDLPIGDPTRRQPDITRARQLLGWEPRVDLEEGLRRTLDDFRARL